MTQGELYIGDKLITEAYLGDEQIEQIYLKETPYLPTDTFIPYSLTGLIRTIVKKIGQLTITDLQVVSGWYQTITRTQNNTCTRTVYDTITPPDTVDTGGPITIQIGQQYRWDFATTTVADGQTISMRSATLSFNAQTTYNNEPFSVSIGVNTYNYLGNQSSTPYSFDNASNPIIWKNNTGYSYLYISNVALTKKWNSYQKARLEEYPCPTYYTNANFRSLNIPIDSNTAELVIENNQQVIGICRLYSSTNTNLGNLITNQNVKYATINNRAGASYNFELTCTNPGVNWFTGLFLKDIFNNQSLNDIQYEFEVIATNDLTQNQVTTAVTADNNNRNIYNRKIILNNIDFDYKKLKNRVRSDRKNLIFVIKDQNVLLNHYFVNDTVYIEIPDKYLKSGEMIINCLVMPLDFTYNGRSEVYNLSTMALVSVDFEYY